MDEIRSFASHSLQHNSLALPVIEDPKMWVFSAALVGWSWFVD
jgi:hypothetical protein